MATQLFTIAKLSGKTGDAALKKISDWSRIDREAERNDMLCPPAVAADVEQFLAQLKFHVPHPSILHFVEFLDTWSVGDCQFHQFLEPFPTAMQVTNPGSLSIAAYRLPDDDALRKHGQRILRRRHIRQGRAPEAKLFALNLLEAIHACSVLIPKSTLILARRLITGSALDEEVSSASKVVAPWMT